MKWLMNRNPLLFLIELYGVGLIGHAILISRNWMILITPYFLILVSLYLIYLLTEFKNHKQLWMLFWIYLNTFIIEVLGVSTGKIFGIYWYGESLGCKLFGVPLVIGLNWVIVLLGAVCIAEKIVKNGWGVAFVSALMVSVYDIILEPVAIHLDYWNWQGGAVPLQNYLAWFCVAFVNAGVFKLFRFSVKQNIFFYHFVIQTVFFILLYFGLKLFPF